MRRQFLQIGRQIDNANRFERTFLHTNTAANAELFRYERDLVLAFDLNALFACEECERALEKKSAILQRFLTHSNDGTGSLALEVAFFRLASIVAHDGNASECLLRFLVGHREDSVFLLESRYAEIAKRSLRSWSTLVAADPDRARGSSKLCKLCERIPQPNAWPAR